MCRKTGQAYKCAQGDHATQQAVIINPERYTAVYCTVTNMIEKPTTLNVRKATVLPTCYSPALCDEAH